MAENEDVDEYELAVVGLGLIGCGALRHAALADIGPVIGIGPGEPPDWTAHEGPFASHYDSGRITRRLDAKREWAILASRAIEQYPLIEAASGIDFHEPVGLLFVRNDAEGIANQRDVIAQLDLPVDVMAADERRTELPELHFPPSFTTLREPAPAGFIDPMRMVPAQLAAAGAAGAHINRGVVTQLERDGESFAIDVEGGNQPITAKRVVVAAGAYSNGLLTNSGLALLAPLAASVRPEAVVLGEVSETTARTLDIPSFIYLLENELLGDVYAVPPTQYPDGRWYLKIGGSRADADVFTNPAEMAAWMRSSAADDQIDALRDVLTTVLPDVEFVSWSAKPCLITDTASDLPFVDIVAAGVTVAFGGNGHAAKSSDAIGQLSAGLALDREWTDSELDASDFAAVEGPHQPPVGSRHGN